MKGYIKVRKSYLVVTKTQATTSNNNALSIQVATPKVAVENLVDLPSSLNSSSRLLSSPSPFPLRLFFPPFPNTNKKQINDKISPKRKIKEPQPKPKRCHDLAGPVCVPRAMASRSPHIRVRTFGLWHVAVFLYCRCCQDFVTLLPQVFSVNLTYDPNSSDSAEEEEGTTKARPTVGANVW